MNEFLARLKQRKLVQWALAYIAATFAVIQVLDVVAQRFGMSERAEKLVILALALGFIVVLVLAWYHGEQGRQWVSGPELLLIALVLAIGGVVIWRFLGRGAPVPATPAVVVRMPPGTSTAGGTTVPAFAQAGAQPTAPIAAAAIPAKSVAVLPFVNESGNQDQQYFSDGLSEDLITTLSQLGGLKVINRDSSFRFRNSKDTVQVIAAKLGVAHLLEGSVQRAGDEVRISATLVNAADGSVVWSQRYDKPYKDLFALQDAITRAVADALQAKLMTTPGAVVQSDRPPDGSLAAYNAYLQGEFHGQRDSAADQRESIHFFQQAVRIDPKYALAYAGIARTWINLAGNFLQSVDKRRVAYAKARAAVAFALKLAPDLAAAHLSKADVLAIADLDRVGANAELQRAAELAPRDANVQAALANSRTTLGHPQQAVELLRQALQLDPLCAGCYGSLAMNLRATGDLEAAAQAARKALELRPAGYFTRMELVYMDVMRGDAVSAIRDAQQEPSGTWRDMAMAMALQIGGDHVRADAALQGLIDTEAGDGAYQIAEIFALRGDPDNMFKWLERARINHDPGVGELLTDPPILRYKSDPRFAAFCKQVGLPSTTDAVAMK